jgi:hypothetical protein
MGEVVNMSRWTKSVSDAISIIDEVERCVVELGYHIDVELMPYKTSGGRGNGITATFSYYNRETTDNEHKYMSVSIWNHHNSDNICIKMTDYPPAVCFMGSNNEDHKQVGIESLRYHPSKVSWAMSQHISRENPKIHRVLV